MAMKDLPRPWMLAALADVPIDELTRQDRREPHEDQRVGQLPRPDERRRRLTDWRCFGPGHGVSAHRPN
jgi:hypothetical protein